MSDRYRENELELMAALTNFRRSYEAIASALNVAGLDDVAADERPGRVMRHLLRNRGEIDALAAESLFLALVGFMAHISGESPRTIYEAYFKSAPSDEWWHERLGDGA
jgi:hypothetical protein